MDDHGRFGLKTGAKADIAGGLKWVTSGPRCGFRLGEREYSATTAKW